MHADAARKKSVQGAQALHRAIHLLRIIGNSPKEGARLTDIAQEAELTTPTTHRLLKALLGEGLLYKKSNSSLYQLGPLVYELGLLSKQQFNTVEFCTPIIKVLAHKVSGTVFLYSKSHNDVACIIKEEAHNSIPTPHIFAGQRQPLGITAAGICILATMPKDKIDKVFEHNRALYKKLNVEIDAIQQQLELARTQGYALSTNNITPDTVCVAIPIMGKHGTAVASVMVKTRITNTKQTLTSQIEEVILPSLKGGCHEIKLLVDDAAHLQ